MGSTTLAFVAACAALVLLMAGVRRLLARRGSGRLGQLEFRRRHGERVAELLGGSPDPRPGSPWIAIRVGGRPARMVAAPIGGGQLQAGIELLDHESEIDVFHTSGEPDELGLPPGVDTDAVLDVVDELRQLEVDNVARPAPGATHVMRVRFRQLEELPERLAVIAPLLAQLEDCSAQAPKDCAQ